MRRRERENTGVERIKQEEVRVPLHTRTQRTHPTQPPHSTQTPALPTQSPQLARQALTRIWFRSCSASCLSCSSSLMAPGPWGGIGGGWGAAGRGLGEAAPRRWPEAWGMQG